MKAKVEITNIISEVKDIFTKGNILCWKHDSNNLVLIVDTKLENTRMFAGVRIDKETCGGYSETFLKCDWEQFHGEIKLSI